MTSFDELAAAEGLPPGPAALWPWGSGTVEDPYYTPEDYVFGSSIPEYLAAHPEDAP